MKGNTVVPDDHHISRLAQPGKCIDGRVTAAAFRLRDDETYLSVNWLESLGLPTRTTQIQAIQSVLGSKLSLRPSARIAVLNVGKTRNHVTESSGLELEVLHQPEPDDPSHSGIHGLLTKNDPRALWIETLIANTIEIEDVYPAVP